MHGCKIIPKGCIFKLLGILMEFKVPLHQMWKQVYNRVQKKSDHQKGQSKGYQQGLANRVLVLKHILIPTTIFSLPNSLERLCRNFLQSKNSQTYKLPEVAWHLCTQPKEIGGWVGPCEPPQRLGRSHDSQWIIRSLTNPKQDWSILLGRNCHKFHLKDFPRWSTSANRQIKAKGSTLVTSIWSA